MSGLLLVALILYAVCATYSFATSDRKDAEALLAALRLDALRGQQKPKPHQCYSYAWYDGVFASKAAQLMSRFSLIDCEDCLYGERNDHGFCVLWFEFAPKNDDVAPGVFKRQMKALIKRWVYYNYNGFDTPVYPYPLPDHQQGYAFGINQEQVEKLKDWENKRVAWERAESARTKQPMKTKKSV